MMRTIQLHALLQQLSALAAASNSLADVTDGQLDSVPPDGSFRFADGKRPLEQVIAGVLRHQDHHLGALKDALMGADV